MLSSGYHNTAPSHNGGGGSTLSAAAMVAAATATATATASVVAMQDRQDIPTQYNQVVDQSTIHNTFAMKIYKRNTELKQRIIHPTDAEPAWNGSSNLQHGILAERSYGWTRSSRHE